VSDARIFRVVVPVADIDVAIAFYSTLLDDPGLPTGAPNRYYFSCGDVILACVQPTAMPTTEGFRPNPDILYFAVDDLEAALARSQRAGAQGPNPLDHGATSTIEVQPWGERSFYLRDPFGNPLCFVESQTAFTGLAAP
jgi:predicted enzyme related to lactoylglutathione lyase